MAKGKDALALILGAPDGDEPSGDDPDELTDDTADLEAEFDEAIVRAFPELADDPDRSAALKEAIRACVKLDAKGGY